MSRREHHQDRIYIVGFCFSSNESNLFHPIYQDAL